MGFGGGVQLAPGAIGPDRKESDRREEFHRTLRLPSTAMSDRQTCSDRSALFAAGGEPPVRSGERFVCDEARRRRPITIGDGSWLASGCTVTNGVTIGRANLICANSVVTHDTPDYAIMAGTPAGRSVRSIRRPANTTGLEKRRRRSGENGAISADSE